MSEFIIRKIIESDLENGFLESLDNLERDVDILTDQLEEVNYQLDIQV